MESENSVIKTSLVLLKYEIHLVKNSTKFFLSVGIKRHQSYKSRNARVPMEQISGEILELGFGSFFSLVSDNYENDSIYLMKITFYFGRVMPAFSTEPF